MLFVVVALFLICWFPLQLYNFLNVYKPEINEYNKENKNKLRMWICRLLHKSNSSAKLAAVSIDKVI